MPAIFWEDLELYPAIEFWVWGDRNIPYQVVDQLTEDNQIWFIITDGEKDFRINAERVRGWSATDPKLNWTPAVGEKVEVWHCGAWLGATIIDAPHKHPNPAKSASFWKILWDFDEEHTIWNSGLFRKKVEVMQ
jgi:hypothetical protein